MDRKISTTAELVARNAREYPDAPFLNFYDEVVTYRDLDQRTDAFAAYLQKSGIQKGDIVSLMMGNSPCFFDILFGAQKAGAAAGPISCWWQAGEVEFLVNDSKPKVLVVDPEYAQIISSIKDKIPSVLKIIVNSPAPMALDFPHEYLPAIISETKGYPDTESLPSDEDVAAVLYTSGTTGKPKGVMLTHKGLMFGALIKTRHIPVAPGEKILCVLPLFHGGGLCDLSLPTIYSGATIVLRKNFSASEFWAKYDAGEFD